MNANQQQPILKASKYVLWLQSKQLQKCLQEKYFPQVNI